MGEPLDLLARRITACLKRGADHYASAGRSLAEARQKCEEDGILWTSWVAENISWSMRYCQKLIKYAAETDPFTAVVDENGQGEDVKRERSSLHTKKSRKSVEADSELESLKRVRRIINGFARLSHEEREIAFRGIKDIVDPEVEP